MQTATMTLADELRALCICGGSPNSCPMCRAADGVARKDQALSELISEADDHPGWEGHKHAGSYGFQLARAALRAGSES